MSAVMPGMAATDTFYGEPKTFKWSMQINRFDRVLRARGVIATMRTKPRAEKVLVATNNLD